jgi:hypothetical protein
MPVLTARAAKIKIFFHVDLEAGNSFTIIWLIGLIRLDGESRLKIKHIASQ